VLTAAHCVAARRPIGVAFGSSLGESEETPVARSIVHAKFDGESLQNDIALVELAVDAEVTPVEWASSLEAPLAVEEPIRIVGFGGTEKSEPHRKRTGMARVSAVEGSAFATAAGPSLPCSGDSGGPAFANVGGREVLVGVTSRGDWDCAKRAWHTDVRLAADLLEQIDEEDARQDASGCSLAPARHRRSPLASFASFAGIASLLTWMARKKNAVSNKPQPAKKEEQSR
jgi:hypothetical protein